ncbi:MULTISPECIES: ATP-grasp peptide maturase system methyltransferase [Streptomyces]|uniref:Protein-L-isoaspartate O-methyltransferase n=2 Tax=Streptomyces avermitilis TaxID=33903 RepID=Q82RM0_STRAW|nr:MULTISPECIES: ATP-grasp peptide maturase system methyltransferase [Streptomyces]MYS95841.1 methyltransferase domain-containing protein [Streptomyces sp. SID5469]BAC67832.1 putative O-methyltransferase [Streptomyces avermitilis MA-4680 = NBRC 14893]BBJ47519.1 SAM-dependent methyltransferase [Streptomyces avermitilis]
MTDPADLRRQLANTIPTDDPAWRHALQSVPREIFLGDALFRLTGPQWEPIHRDQTAPGEWLRLIYQDTTWVTQIDGVNAADACSPTTGRPTSSSTLPSLIVRMLDLAGTRDGDNVLEIGTGTGYSTAILCERLGDEHVFSVEYDPGLAAAAADHIHAAGYHPTLNTGDGLAGHKDGAEYDAIIATCAVRHIPPTWLYQVRAGGTITTTISGWMLASGLIRLTVHDDGTATGRFADDQISYMLARPHERPPRPTYYQHPGHTRPTRVNPALLDDWTGHFLAQLAAPSAELMNTTDGVILVDVATGSQAWTEPAGNSWHVHQHGPLNLWDQVENTLTTWQRAGSPPQSDLGMTVEPDGTQRVWLGAPDGPSWDLPV